MRIDTHLQLGSIYSSPESFRDAIVSVAQHVAVASKSENWSQHLRFITPVIYEPPPWVIEKLRSNPHFRRHTTRGKKKRDRRGQLERRESSMRGMEGQLERHESPMTEMEDPCSCAKFEHRYFYDGEQSLRITDPSNTPGCGDYVAVSYCWASSAKAEYNGPNLTIEDGDAVRPPHCPPSVLQRAIGYAGVYKRAFVWIDQDCIHQDDRNDVQAGIGAMDRVYSQATDCVGILEATITKQGHLDALASLLEAEDMVEDELVDLIEVMEIISADPWFERAWTLQESICGLPYTKILVRHDTNLDIPPTLDLNSIDIELDLSALNSVLESWFLTQLDAVEDIKPSTIERANCFIDQWFNNTLADIRDNSHEGIFARPICEAAEVAAYLTKRHNSVVPDRVAILANLCAYERIPDTRALDEGGFDFTVSALAFSILNGDVTLLSGHADVKAGRTGKQRWLSSEEVRTDGFGFSWCPPPDWSMQDSAFLYREEALDVVRIKVLSLTSAGLVVIGCIWTADLVLDMKPIRNKLQEMYGHIRLQRLISRFEHSSDLDRSILVTMVNEVIARVRSEGCHQLANSMWVHLRLQPPQNQLRNSQEVQEYWKAPFDAVVDPLSGDVRWPRPWPAITLLEQDPYDALSSAFVRFLLLAVGEKGSLLVARPAGSEASAGNYAAIFEGTQHNDLVFSPVNDWPTLTSSASGDDSNSDLGLGTPHSRFTWAPLCWRVKRISDHRSHAADTFSCHGLIAGNWIARSDFIKPVLLV